jgi:hypothetical protein
MKLFNSKKKRFNSALAVRKASDSGLILPKNYDLGILYDATGAMGLAGNPYSHGEAIHTMPQQAAEMYLKDIKESGQPISDDARDLFGIETDSKTGLHSIETTNGLLAHTGTPLNDWATIPIKNANGGGASTGLVHHHLFNSSDPNETIGDHPLGFSFGAGHYVLPGESDPVNIINGRMFNFSDIMRHAQRIAAKQLSRDAFSTDLKPEDAGKQYMRSMIRFGAMFEPDEILNEEGKLTGWKPHNASSSNHMLVRPVPVHFAAKQALQNILTNPHSRKRLDLSRSTGANREYDQYLMDRLDTAEFGLDLSPINCVNHHFHPNFLLRDQQDIIRGLRSEDKILSGIINKIYRPSSNRDGSISFQGLKPRASLALGNTAWSTGANQAVILGLRKHAALINSYNAAKTEPVMPLDRSLTLGAQERARQVLERRPDGEPDVDTGTLPNAGSGSISDLSDLYGI